MTKTMTFTVMHFAIAFAVAYLMTGSLIVGGAVALVEPAINAVAFHCHEIVWRRREMRMSHSLNATNGATCIMH